MIQFELKATIQFSLLYKLFSNSFSVIELGKNKNFNSIHFDDLL